MHTYVAIAADDDCYGKLNGMKNEISIVRFYTNFQSVCACLSVCVCTYYFVVIVMNN